MRPVAILVLALVLAGQVSADPASVNVNPRIAVSIPFITNESIGKFSGPGESVVPGLVDADGRFYFPLQGAMLALLDKDFSTMQKTPVSPGGFYSSASKIRGAEIVGTVGGGTFAIYAINGIFLNARIEYEKSLTYVVSISNLLIFRTDDSAIRYVIYCIALDGTARRMEHEEALLYIQREVTGATVRDGVLYYKGNILDRRLSYNQIDDDGNFYASRTVVIGGRIKYGIHSSTDSYGNYLQSFIDNEGNFWAMDFTKDDKQSLVLLYAGRDWGYRELPKKAVTTDSGLRIRLRAMTDAFVLGTMVKDQAITILKTGETVTIGGIKAPWYRIKTADGLIGWAFGGFIRLVE